MLDFVKNFYRTFIEVVLWFILIVCIIVGFKLGNTLGRAFLGAMLGLLFGVVFDVFLGGLVATFIAIEQNTTKTFKLLHHIYENSANGASMMSEPQYSGLGSDSDTFEVLDDEDTFEVNR